MIEKFVRPSTYTDDDIDKVSVSVVFKLDQDRLLIQRIVYSILDYLGDIGGLFGTFTGLATAFSLILNFHGVYHLLTSLLFKVETPNMNSSQKANTSTNGAEGLKSLFASKLAAELNSRIDKTTNIQEFQRVNQNFFTTLILNFKLIVPKSCRCLCCKESTKDRIFTQGYHKLKQEIEISSILKNLRVVKAAIKLGFTEPEWKRFKEENEVRKLYLIN